MLMYGFAFSAEETLRPDTTTSVMIVRPSLARAKPSWVNPVHLWIWLVRVLLQFLQFIRLPQPSEVKLVKVFLLQDDIRRLGLALNGAVMSAVRSIRTFTRHAVHADRVGYEVQSNSVPVSSFCNSILISEFVHRRYPTMALQRFRGEGLLDHNHRPLTK
jgi:hypothetical protein